MEEEKTNTENTNTENTGAESSGAESTAAETPAETTTETATAPEPAPAATPEPVSSDDAGEKKRPVFLTVLCILTFVGSGLGLLTSLLMVVGVGALMDMLGSFGGGVLGGGVAYFGVAALMAAASLYGAIMMWKLKKTGFYIYTGANVIAAILPIVWLGGGFAIMSMIWPVLFIVLYGLNLKHLS